MPEIPSDAKRLAKRYNAMYVGPNPKLVYLTFDEGYENGNTPAILDTLKRDGVHATFFVTGDYCREAPKLCRRMLAEGHVVGSHSNTHPSMPSLTGDPTRFDAQLTKADAAFKKATGQHLTHLFRPPMGDYSARSLAMTQRLGYTSVFWSFAHVDYDEKHQPPVPATISLVLSGSHPGAIFLLHAISTSDTAALRRDHQGAARAGLRVRHARAEIAPSTHAGDLRTQARQRASLAHPRTGPSTRAPSGAPRVQPRTPPSLEGPQLPLIRVTRNSSIVGIR